MAKIIYKDLINAHIEALNTSSDHRGYLGISQLGHECDRYLYYVLHDAYRNPIPPRVARLWERGDWEEHRIVRDLKKIGCTVTDQQKEISIFGGVIKGHIDGIASGVPGAEKTKHLLEIKTMADAYWKVYCKKGIKKSNPAYWVQGQLYAGYLDLTRILFVAVNKNTEERHFERIVFEPTVVSNYEARALSVIGATDPPNRIGGVDWWTCKICSMNGICHGNDVPNKVCRSCKYASMGVDKLTCAKGHTKSVPTGCKEWESCV